MICGWIDLCKFFSSVDGNEEPIRSRIVLTVSSATTKLDGSYFLVCFRVDNGVCFAVKVRDVNLVLLAGVSDAVWIIASWSASDNGETLIVNHCQFIRARGRRIDPMQLGHC